MVTIAEDSEVFMLKRRTAESLLMYQLHRNMQLIHQAMPQRWVKLSNSALYIVMALLHSFICYHVKITAGRKVCMTPQL